MIPFRLFSGAQDAELIAREMRDNDLLDEITQLIRAPKFLARLSLALVGRVGRSQARIWALVKAIRLKWISASGASSRNVASIFSPALTPEGSKSPR
jgi:hypothetical protein